MTIYDTKTGRRISHFTPPTDSEGREMTMQEWEWVKELRRLNPGRSDLRFRRVAGAGLIVEYKGEPPIAVEHHTAAGKPQRG